MRFDRVGGCDQRAPYFW